MSLRQKSLGVVSTLVGVLIGGASLAALPASHVFDGFTSHIQRQVELDKEVFVHASTCTEWFYKQKQQKPPKPPVTGVSLSSEHASHSSLARIVEPAVDCRTRYPEGLKAAREDFSRTQSTLSLSLTFYEFALVGDRNDDRQYSAAELKDILDSFSLPSQPELPATIQLSRLNAQFDSVHQAGHLDVLVTGMGELLEKGYRFTYRDKEALNRIMG